MSNWLIGVTCAAMLAAVARSVMPAGAVRQVGNLVCAMMLLWAVLKPLNLNIKPEFTIMDRTRSSGLELEEKGGQILKSLIEQESGTYIVDKAAQLGIECSVRVSCVPGEGGVWLPEKAWVSGEFTQEQRRELGQILTTELGIHADMQEFTGGG